MSSLSVPSPPCLGLDLDDEIVVGVSGETIISSCGTQGRNSLPVEPISGYFILEIDLTNRGPDIVRMEPLLRRYMFKSDLGSLKNLLEGKIVPRVRGRCVRFGPVDDSPIVIVVFMGVECDLLF